MNKLQKIKNKKIDILIVSAILVVILIFISFVYKDITETTRHGMTMWDALFQGKLKDFYVLNNGVTISERFGNNTAAIYDFPLYIVFAIWNLPLWIYEHVTGNFAMDTYAGLLWAKSISIPFLVGIYIYTVKIGKKINDNFSEIIAFLLFMTSVLLLTPVLIMGQYDAIGLFFILIGFYKFIVNDRKGFIFWFSIAITFKMFALFVFFPLMLLKEKKIIRILGDLVGGCSLLVICKVLQQCLFNANEMGTEYVGSHLLTFIFQSQIGFVYGASSLFILLYVLLCMYCYFKKTPEEENLSKWALYVSFLGLIIFFISSLTHPQWSLLLLPFSVLLICCAEPQYQKIGMWVETIYSIGLLIAQFIYYYWVFDIETSIYMLAGLTFYDGEKDIGYSISNLLTDFFNGIDVWYFNLIGGGIFVAGILFFVYWSHPETLKNKLVELEISYESIILVRLLLMIATGVLMTVLMF